jgi:peptide-methionine (S)-S-oxide reductase
LKHADVLDRLLTESVAALLTDGLVTLTVVAQGGVRVRAAAEAYHQQYFDKNPAGYCPNHATGVTLPEGFFKSEASAGRVADAARAIEQAR